MGNNHDQYFGKEKRKIIILGLEGSGKSTLVNYLIKEKLDYNLPKTKNFNIYDKKIQNLHITFFDLGGAQRQRIFWKQQYQGTQGVIFVIDATRFQNQKASIFQQLKKLCKHIESQIPFCICLNKVEKSNMQGVKTKDEIQKKLSSIKKNFKMFELDYKNRQSSHQMMKWLLNQTHAI